MANLDNPRGFVPYGPPGTTHKYETAASQTIAIGDFVTLDASKQVTIATATSDNLLGMAASPVTSSSAGDAIQVYDDPDQQYMGQCSGTYAITQNGAEVDIEGTTGIMEVNENAALKRVLVVVGLYGDPKNAVGANADVYVRINEHKHALGASVDGATTNFGPAGIKADVIAESTSANGVAVDGVTHKDGGVILADGAVLEVDTINEATAAAGVTVDGVLCKDSDVLVTDNNELQVGTGADLTMSHNATNSIVTSKTGDLIVDNTLVTGSTIVRLGADTSAVDFQVQNNSEVAQFTVTGAGDVTITRDLVLTGHKAAQKLHPSHVIFHAPATEWGWNATNTIYSMAKCPASQTGKTCLITFPVKAGDEIVGGEVEGFAVETNELTLDAAPVFLVKATGEVDATGLAVIGNPFTQVDAGGTFGDTFALDAVYTVLEDGVVGIRLTATTGVDDVIDVTNATLTVNRK